MGDLGQQCTALGIQALVPKKHFPNFLFFSFVLTKKYFEAAIIDFTMHLILLKWLKRQKCRQKRKRMRQKKVEAKKQTLYKSIFIHLNT